MKKIIGFISLVLLFSGVGLKGQDAAALEEQYKTCARHYIPTDKCTPEIYKQLKDKENAPLEHNVAPSLSGVQTKWTRIEKTDALRGTTSARFTMEGKFLEAPQQSKISSPTFVVDCDPNKWRDNRHQHGKLLDAYIAVGAVLDTKVGLESGLVGERVVSGLNVEYRLDDGKVKSFPPLSHSTDFSAIFLSSTLGNFSDFKDEILGDVLYSHKAAYKENTSVPSRKVVIQVSEYLGGNITMEFDFPDPTEVADSCGLFLYKKKQ